MKTTRSSVAPLASEKTAKRINNNNNINYTTTTSSNNNNNNNSSSSSSSSHSHYHHYHHHHHQLANSMVLVISSDKLKVLIPNGKKSPQLLSCHLRLTDTYLTFKFDCKNVNPTNQQLQQPSSTTTRVTTADCDNDETALLVSDIIGCKLIETGSILNENSNQHSNANGQVTTTTNVTNNTSFTIYAYPCKQSNLLTFSKYKKRTRVELTFIVDEFECNILNAEKASQWVRAINWLKYDQSYIIKDHYKSIIPITEPKVRRLLVFINPASGPGKANTIFKDNVAPLLAESSIDFKPIITKNSGDAKNYVKNASLNELLDGIVIISGDGLIFEVINGLMERSDRDAVMKIPLGIIPGGSGNGLAHSINFAVG